jgi:hypothetical protein
LCLYLTGLGSEGNRLATPITRMDLDPSASSPDCSGPDTQCKRFGLFPVRSPLLGEYSLGYPRACFLFLRLLRCFSSPGCHLAPLCIHGAGKPTSSAWVSPFGDPRVKGCLPPRRGLSQAATSFIDFLCQGIHHILLCRFSHVAVRKRGIVIVVVGSLIIRCSLNC